jgi:sugar phosphate isomerase/epimerase
VLDTPACGVCLDVGHARLLGDPVDAIETASGHIIAAHVHDTRGARDEHLVPYDGSIDWTRTLLAFQKVGYTGPWTFELAPGPAAALLAKAAQARQRFEQRLGINDELMSQ